MSDERSEDQAPSVFGNLPAARPGTRSPRRSSGASDLNPEAAPRPASRAQPEARATAEPPRTTAAAAEPDELPPGDEPGTHEAPGGLEDLAWAGVAAAAEAATLGVRLTTRAVEALRDAASRR